MPASPAIIIGNARVLNCSKDKTERCDVVLDGGRIAALFSASMAAKTGGATFIDAGGGLVMPGLVNAHTHSPENLARGRSERSRLPEWLGAVWPAIDALTPAQATLAIELGAAEMIRSGVTAVVDHFRQTPMREDVLRAAVAAYTATGLRSTIAVMLRDGRSPSGRLTGAPHVTAAPDASDQVALVHHMQREIAAGSVTLAYGPSAPHRCSDALLDLLAGLDSNSLIHTHLDETAGDAEQARARFGCTAIAHLDRLGLLRSTTACAHAIHVSRNDIERLAERQAAVVHNPVSNLRLGSGIAPVPAFIGAGIPVALGTDGAASNDTQDLWESVKLAALLSRIGEQEAGHWPAAATILDMATRRGHAATGLARTEPLAGTISAGAPADLIVFDRDPLSLHSDDAPAASLVFGRRREPRHVIANGRFLMRDRELVTIDEAGLRRRLSEATDLAA